MVQYIDIENSPIGLTVRSTAIEDIGEKLKMVLRIYPYYAYHSSILFIS